MTRLLGLKAADMMDKIGNKAAAAEIAMIKVQAPNMTLQIIDDAIQAHGGGGVSDDFGLANAYAHQRTLRLAAGPDSVPSLAIARIQLAHPSPARVPVFFSVLICVSLFFFSLSPLPSFSSFPFFFFIFFLSSFSLIFFF